MKKRGEIGFCIVIGILAIIVVLAFFGPMIIDYFWDLDMPF